MSIEFGRVRGWSRRNEKNPGGFPFFNGLESPETSQAWGIDLLEFIGYNKSYIFLTRKILFLLKLVGGKKLKNPYWEWITVESRQRCLILFFLSTSFL